MAECYMSLRDYHLHCDPDAKPEPQSPSWTGEEHRIATTPRRATAHDRRWDNQRGRRYRIGDRRHA